MLEKKELFKSETATDIEKFKSDLLREHFSGDSEKDKPENNRLDVHDRAVGILEMNRERMVKELAQEIKRISWLDENELENAAVVKRIPEIGQDLRSGAIKKMLVEKYKVIPGTQAADEKMSQLYEIWARKWMEALEAGKKPKKSVDMAEAPSLPAKEAGEKKDFGKYVWPKEERDLVKAVALHTFVNLPSFEDVNAETAEKGGKKVNEMAKKVWGVPTVHGFLDPEHPNPETGEPGIARRTDLDGRGYLAILKKAGFYFDMKDVGYVKQGDLPKSGRGLVGDTANEDGVVAKNFGELLISDHHGEKSGRDTSATRNKYEALVASGDIERSDALDDFVEFVTKEDNKDYTEDECKKIIENFDGNLIGLQRYMNGEDVIKVFEEYAEKGEELDPYEKLPSEIIENLKFENSNGDKMELKDVLQKLKNTKEALKREVEAMKKEGLFIETDQYGTILIDAGRLDGKSKKIKKRLGSNLAIEAARAAGHGGVVWWNPDANSFSIQVANRGLNFTLSEGENYRGRYWLKTPSSAKMKTTLEEILGKLTGQENFQMDKKLNEALEKAGKPKGKERTADQKKISEKLEAKFPFQRVIGNISQNLSEEKKEKGQRIRETFVREAKIALEDIARDSSEKEVSFFMNEMMDQILAYYRGEKGKTRGSDELKKMRAKTIGFIKDIAEKKGFDKKSVDYIVRYFRNIFQIEFLANNSK